MFISILSTWFEHSSAHHKEIQLYQYEIWYMSLCIGDRLVCRLGWSAIQACILAGMCSSSGDSNVSIRNLVYVTLYRWPSGMQAWMECHPSLHTSRHVLIIRRFNCINTTSGICHSDHLVCRFGWNVQTCIPDDHLHRVTYTRYRIDKNWISWWWAHAC